MTPCMLYTTWPTQQEAQSVSKELISGKLAACANILPSMTAIYEWEGELTEDQEVVMLVKTTNSKAQQAIDFIVKKHPYDCPAVMQIPIQGGHLPFLTWIAEQTQ